MDAFFASVEQRDEPALKGLPVAVGGLHRGVVAAASYEARRFGVRSAMPMSAALKLCPELKVIPPHFDRYKAASEAVFSLFRQVTPLVEGVSLDEAYLDVTQNAWQTTLGVEVARRLKREIFAHTGLTASAGVAPNKFLAKIASGWRKPDGLTVIAPDRVELFLSKLPVDALWGVGPVTAQKLKAAGLHRLVDVRKRSEAELAQIVGHFAPTLLRLSLGQDDRPVEPHRERKSIGNETSFSQDLTLREQTTREIQKLAAETCEALNRHKRYARTVTIKVRYGNFQTVTRSETLAVATQNVETIVSASVALLLKTDVRPVRLLGVSVHGLCEKPGLPPTPEHRPEQLLLPLVSE